MQRVNLKARSTLDILISAVSTQNVLFQLAPKDNVLIQNLLFVNVAPPKGVLGNCNLSSASSVFQLTEGIALIFFFLHVI